VKIGFRCVIKLLECGATVIVTTRFPVDAARRYAEHPGFAEWSHRLQVFGAVSHYGNIAQMVILETVFIIMPATA